jgi:hypothetical protein
MACVSRLIDDFPPVVGASTNECIALGAWMQASAPDDADGRRERRERRWGRPGPAGTDGKSLTGNGFVEVSSRERLAYNERVMTTPANDVITPAGIGAASTAASDPPARRAFTTVSGRPVKACYGPEDVAGIDAAATSGNPERSRTRAASTRRAIAASSGR